MDNSSSGKEPGCRLSEAGVKKPPRCRCTGAVSKFGSRSGSGLQRTAQVVQLHDAVGVHEDGQLFCDVEHVVRPHEVGGAYLHGVRAGKDELQHIRRVGYAAHADNRNVHRLAHLPYATQRHGLDGRSGQATHHVGQPRSAGFQIHSHAEQGVDAGQHVGPGVGHGFGHHGDVRHIGRELHNDGHVAGRVLHCAGYGSRLDRVLAEGLATCRHVGAGDIHLQRGKARIRGQSLRQFPELGRVAGVQVGDDSRVFMGQGREFLFQKFLHPHVLQANGVEHAARRLGHALHGVAFARLEGKPFDHDAAQLLQLTEGGVLQTISERAGCGHDGIFELQARQRDASIRWCRRFGSHVDSLQLYFVRPEHRALGAYLYVFAFLVGGHAAQARAHATSHLVFQRELCHCAVFGGHLFDGLQERRWAAGKDQAAIGIPLYGFVNHFQELGQILGRLLMEVPGRHFRYEIARILEGVRFNGQTVAEYELQLSGGGMRLRIRQKRCQAHAAGQHECALVLHSKAVAKRTPHRDLLARQRLGQTAGAAAKGLDEQRQTGRRQTADGKGAAPDELQPEAGMADHDELPGTPAFPVRLFQPQGKTVGDIGRRLTEWHDVQYGEFLTRNIAHECGRFCAAHGRAPLGRQKQMTDMQSETVQTATRRRPEILAPAGDRQAFLAALAAGADAVYMGLKHFSARMQASNFAVKETLSMADLAHEHGAKLYLAFNTLLKPGDLGAAGRLIDRLSRPGSPTPDAIIAQDLGTLKVARQAGYEGELHFSTLAALSPTAGLQTAAELGVSRVVLPRELDIEEIKAMAEVCPEGMDLEVFVHGALCYAVSGRCYWSTALGGKSGLRGRCVQPCRRIYEMGKRKDRFFSCFDLSLDLMVKTLLDVPQVTCWKIEGRKKGAHYVFYTTTAYRMLRDEGKDPAIRKEAEAILERALGRPTSRSRFLPQSRQIPLPGPKDAGRTGSGLFVGTVARTPEGAAYLKPRVPLMGRDLLRIGSEDEKHHRILKVSKAVPKAGTLDIPPDSGPFPKKSPGPKSASFRDDRRGKGGKGGKFAGKDGKGVGKGGKRPFVPRGKVPPSGTPVYLVDRKEPELMERINAMEAEAKKMPEPKTPGSSNFQPQLPRHFDGRPASIDMLVRRAPPKGKDSKFRGQLGMWMSPRLIDQVSRTFLPRTWWWLPPVIWPDEEKLWRAVLLRMVKQGARTFVLNAPWQMALLPERQSEQHVKTEGKRRSRDWQILAGPFCNISNGLAVESLAELGFTGAIVSPELGKDDYLELPKQSPLPLGIVSAGFWAACVSRHVPAAIKRREPLTSPKGEVYWPRTLGQNLWLFPSWPVDFSEHRQTLENAGYRWFVNLDETRPKEVADPGRTTVMNWDGGVLQGGIEAILRELENRDPPRYRPVQICFVQPPLGKVERREIVPPYVKNIYVSNFLTEFSLDEKSNQRAAGQTDKANQEADKEILLPQYLQAQQTIQRFRSAQYRCSKNFQYYCKSKSEIKGNTFYFSRKASCEDQ
eukprot:TRINITY_DN12185_c0_g1_i3.p1 TRINITY_DN12185_c0_g1~~TRINITY_DN12185_c0_g1_i3.p1  ORF type:complete len:1508 (+),score=369.80 TRINITY_DN12185_c0_g1_i3:8011-12534(+)